MESKFGHTLPKEIDFAELSDGTLVELVEDPKNPGQTCLAIAKDGNKEINKENAKTETESTNNGSRTSAGERKRLDMIVVPG